MFSARVFVGVDCFLRWAGDEFLSEVFCILADTITFKRAYRGIYIVI
jgi:hypothetical protein